MGKRESGEEVVRRVGRDALGFLTEAGFAAPSAFVEVAKDSATGRCRAAVEGIYAECGLGAPNHLPGTAGNARLTEVRVRAFARALKELLPYLLGPDRDAVVRRAAAR
ncbi:hypothetical protein [Streptomyces sp. NPDC006335]|uniref:hypothetical protein n=1 Tax=Streptomyces sp. NPDC006335 TaxID=3156895 RepID=UPI0033BB4435